MLPGMRRDPLAKGQGYTHTEPSPHKYMQVAVINS